MPLVTNPQFRPSLKAGYAQSASESANPELWKGLRRAYAPSIGETGSTLRDFSGLKKHATRVGTAWGWGVVDGVNCLTTSTLTSASYFSIPGLTGFFRDFSVIAYLRFIPEADFDVCSLIGRAANRSNLLGIRENNTITLNDDAFGGESNNHTYSGQWETIATVLDGNTIRYYSEGISIGSDDFTGQSMDYSAVDGLFRNGFDQGESLSVGALYVYRRALSPLHIKQLSKDPLAPFRLRRMYPYATQAAAATFNPAWGSPITKMANYWN